MVKDTQSLVANTLEIVVSDDVEIDNLMDIESLALGQTEYQTVGDFALQALKTSGLWEGVADKVKAMVEEELLLEHVTTGEAQAAIVYASDSVATDGITTLLSVPTSTHDPIVYPVGLTNDRTEVSNFYDYLNSEEAINIFVGHGFSQV